MLPLSQVVTIYIKTGFLKLLVFLLLLDAQFEIQTVILTISSYPNPWSYSNAIFLLASS